MLYSSAVEVDKHWPATRRCSEVFDVSGVGDQWHCTHRQRARRQTIHSHHQEHTQSAQHRRQDRRYMRHQVDFGWVLFFSLWTKVHPITCPCNVVFRFTILLTSGHIREVVRNLAEDLMFWGRKFLWVGTPKFLTRFYKFGSHSNMWQSLETISPEISEIRRRKKCVDVRGRSATHCTQHHARTTSSKLHRVRKKVSPFIFCDNSGKCWPIIVIFALL